MVLRISLFLDNAWVNVQKHIPAPNFTVSLPKYENIIFYISNKILRILCIIYIMNYIARAQHGCLLLVYILNWMCWCPWSKLLKWVYYLIFLITFFMSIQIRSLWDGNGWFKKVTRRVSWWFWSFDKFGVVGLGFNCSLRSKHGAMVKEHRFK